MATDNLTLPGSEQTLLRFYAGSICTRFALCYDIR